MACPDARGPLVDRPVTDPVRVEIALIGKSGRLQGHVIVDATDAEFVRQWRWHLGSSGYAQRGQSVDGRPTIILLHRELLGLTFGDGLEGDHLNRNRLDCRRSNLRNATKAENRQNRPSLAGSSSVYRGVNWYARKRKWRAEVKVTGKRFHLGYFDDEIEAARAAREARARLLPFATD